MRHYDCLKPGRHNTETSKSDVVNNDDDGDDDDDDDVDVDNAVYMDNAIGLNMNCSVAAPKAMYTKIPLLPTITNLSNRS